MIRSGLFSLLMLLSQFSHAESEKISEKVSEKIDGSITITQISAEQYMLQRNTLNSCSEMGLISTARWDEFVDELSSQTWWNQIKAGVLYTTVVGSVSLAGLTVGAAASVFTGGSSILIGTAAGVGAGVYSVNYLESKWELKVNERRKIKSALESEDAILMLAGDEKFLDFTAELLKEYLEKTPPESETL